MKDLEGSPDKEPKLKMRKNCYRSINDKGSPRSQKTDQQIEIENQKYIRKTLSSRNF